MLNLARLLLLTLGVFFLTPSGGKAFFPTIKEVESRLRKSLGAIQSVQAVCTFPGYPDVELRIWQSGELWRQEWVSTRDETPVLTAVALGRAQRLLGGYPSNTSFSVPPLWFWKQPDPYVWWARLGIDPGVLSYQFFEGRPCLVIGAATGDFSSPQMWIDAELDVPMRVRSAQGNQWDWYEYRSVANHNLPHRSRTYPASHNATQVVLEWRGVNSDHSRDIYDPALMSRRFSLLQDSEQLPLPLYILQQSLPVTAP